MSQYLSSPEERWTERQRLERERDAAHLAPCDDRTCLALDDPNLDDLDQVRTAYLHWRSHGYLSGCAHGR